MVAMLRVTTTTTGFTGAPGYTNFFFQHVDPPSSAANSAVTLVRGFWEAVGGSFPSGWQYLIDPAVAVVESSDGAIDSFITTTPLTQSVSGNAGGYSAPSGLCINWKTGGVVNSHKVKGRSFMVPLTSAAYQGDGTLNSSEITKFTGAAATMVASSAADLGIWARPFTPKAGDSRPARLGTFHIVTAASVSDKVAVLRSRRD